MKLTQTVQAELTIAQRAEVLIAQKAEAERLLEEAKEGLGALVIENNGEPFLVGDQKVSLTLMPGRMTLSKEKLVAAGVATDLIALGTNVGEDYQQLNVRKASKADLKKEAA